MNRDEKEERFDSSRFLLFFCWTLRNASVQYESPQKAIKENVARHILCVRWTLTIFFLAFLFFRKISAKDIIELTQLCVVVTASIAGVRQRGQRTSLIQSNKNSSFFSGVEAFEGFFLMCLRGFQWASTEWKCT